MEHYTAWITTVRDCLGGDHCDVTVQTDDITGWKAGPDGPDTIPVYESTGPQMFMTDLPERHDGDLDTVFASARAALEQAGWTADNWRAWDAVSTGYTLTVTRNA